MHDNDEEIRSHILSIIKYTFSRKTDRRGREHNCGGIVKKRLENSPQPVQQAVECHRGTVQNYRCHVIATYSRNFYNSTLRWHPLLHWPLGNQHFLHTRYLEQKNISISDTFIKYFCFYNNNKVAIFMTW